MSKITLATPYSPQYVIDNFVFDGQPYKFKRVAVHTPEGKYYVYMNSQRYVMFKAKGLACVKCGKVVNECRLDTEPNSDNAHFNFYHKDDSGNLLLFTKDHIIPVAEGGKNVLDNYVPMCTICNCSKGRTVKKADVETGIEAGLVHQPTNKIFKIPLVIFQNQNAMRVVIAWLDMLSHPYSIADARLTIELPHGNTSVKKRFSELISILVITVNSLVANHE